ncbi:uncharacterized protein LOC129707869 isoform X1 [Leucoraja erinacea]|uniref:uncharacterized protein LOC129707869 isoform X1 n=1 Tax=Leucoraja erinaceus TaxID=7782 RepID=UPI002454926F|nr:uncharacterized protein LOC129707869 isoform X1 [Leucoraja erinacea]XP_055509255.1 uncharacterized protein LOC129707869 isoform X1 [Leucoraja erinacea]
MQTAFADKMAHKDLGRSDVVKHFSVLSKPDGPDSEIETSSAESRVSSKWNVGSKNEKTAVHQGSAVDSSPWDSEEEGLSKHKEIEDEKRTLSFKKLSGHSRSKLQGSTKHPHTMYEDFKETLKDTDFVGRHFQSPGKSNIKKYDKNLDIPHKSSGSKNRPAERDPMIQSSYPGWSDSSSETQPIFSLYEQDNQKKKDQAVIEQNKNKGNIKETLKKNMNHLRNQHKSSQTSTNKPSMEDSRTNHQLVRVLSKEKTEAEAGVSSTELVQANVGLTEESIEPENVGVASEENIVVGIVKDAPSYKENNLIYHFDFGHQNFYETKKEYNEACISNLADWSNDVIRHCWRELFAVVRILMNVVTLFLIELVNFLSRSFIEILVAGLLTAIGDHVLKPLLATLFNSLLQPIMIFQLNIFTAIRNLLNPLIDIIRRLIMQIAALLHAFRLVEVTFNRAPFTHQEV